MNKLIYGYCGMTADFLHVGHIRFLRRCKGHCDHLIVGVMSDDCVEQYKGKRPIMNERERQEILRAIEDVDSVTLQTTFEFPKQIVDDPDFVVFDSDEHRRIGADIIFTRTAQISSSQFKEEQDDYFNSGKLAL